MTLQGPPTAELLDRRAPGVPVEGGFAGHAVPIDADAGRRLLGLEPRFDALGAVV